LFLVRLLFRFYPFRLSRHYIVTQKPKVFNCRSGNSYNKVISCIRTQIHSGTFMTMTGKKNRRRTLSDIAFPVGRHPPLVTLSYIWWKLWEYVSNYLCTNFVMFYDLLIVDLPCLFLKFSSFYKFDPSIIRWCKWKLNYLRIISLSSCKFIVLPHLYVNTWSGMNSLSCHHTNCNDDIWLLLLMFFIPSIL